MGICRYCEKAPARAPYKRLCQSCFDSSQELQRAKAAKKAKNGWSGRREDWVKEYHGTQDAFKAMPAEELLEIVGADKIKAAETPLNRKLKVRRERSMSKRHGEKITIHVKEIPEEPVRDTVRRAVGKKYKKVRKKDGTVIQKRIL